MKPLRLFIICALICQTAWASIPELSEKIDLDITNRWRIFVQTDVQDPPKALEMLANLYDYQLEKKIDALPAISALLLGMAAQDISTQDLTQHEHWKYARRFNPYTPNPHYLICQHGKKTSFVDRAAHCFKGLKLENNLFEGHLFQRAYFSHIMHSTLLATIALIMIFFACKYGPFLFQFIASRFVWLSPMGCGVVLTLLFSSMTLSFGWVFGFLFMTWMFWFFLNRKEKLLMVILMFVTALVPLTFEAPARYLEYQDQVMGSVPIQSSKSQLLFDERVVSEQNQEYRQFIRSMYPRTFFRSDRTELHATLVFSLLMLLLAGMFIHVSDYYYFYIKHQDYTKRMIIKDLQAFPKLYFEYLRSLQRRDVIQKIIYIIVPPYYFFDQNKPILAFVSTFAILLSFFGLFHYLRFFEMYHFLWSWIFGPMFLIFMTVIWLIPKEEKNRSLYAKKI